MVVNGEVVMVVGGVVCSGRGSLVVVVESDERTC